LVPTYTLKRFSELPLYVALALISAVVAVAFVRLLGSLSRLFDNMKLHPALIAALGMVLTALIISILPERQIMGVGLGFIGQAISRDFSMPLLLMTALLILKILATSLTIGSGNSGGVFAPSLFIGAMVGGIFGTAANNLFPDVAIHPGAYAIVGMAAVFAGATRAPITAVLLVFETSNDYKLILPLMLSVVLATLVAEHLYSESIYTIKLRLKGIALQRGRDLDLMQSLKVGEAMAPAPRIVNCEMPLPELGQFFQKTHAHSFPVVDDENKLVGMVSVTDYDRALNLDDPGSRVVKDIATLGNILTAFEDESLSDIMQRIAVRDINQLPVVSRQDSCRVIGVIRRRDIAKAYQIALTRRGRQEAKVDRQALAPVDDTDFLELEIPADSPAANQSLATLARNLPHDSVIVCVRRADGVTIPHGDTVLRPGDLVSVFVRNSDEDELRKNLLGK
jgi:CIC family chloride channel protein